jgi:glucuronate isomerase
MATFMDADFLLDSDVAATLYHEVAADLPIVDHHRHLPVRHIAEGPPTGEAPPGRCS